MNKITPASEMLTISIKENNFYEFRNFINCQKKILKSAKYGETNTTCYLADDYIKMLENKGYKVDKKINNHVVSWD